MMYRYTVNTCQWRRKAGKLGGLSVAVLWLLVQRAKRTHALHALLLGRSGGMPPPPGKF